jgi:hypothetical protein
VGWGVVGGSRGGDKRSKRDKENLPTNLLRPSLRISFAMIFYNLLAGHAPWPAMNGVRAVKAAAIEGSRPQIPRHWDTDLDGLIQSCWDENPKVRPPFAQILEVLSEYHFATFKETVDDMTSLDNNIVGGRGVFCGCTVS